MLPVELFVDNKGAIDLSKRPVFSKRSKHLRLHAHYVHECYERGELILIQIPSEENTADIFTKALTWQLHAKHVEGLGLISDASASGGVGG